MSLDFRYDLDLALRPQVWQKEQEAAGVKKTKAVALSALPGEREEATKGLSAYRFSVAKPNFFQNVAEFFRKIFGLIRESSEQFSHGLLEAFDHSISERRKFGVEEVQVDLFLQGCINEIDSGKEIERFNAQLRGISDFAFETLFSPNPIEIWDREAGEGIGVDEVAQLEESLPFVSQLSDEQKHLLKLLRHRVKGDDAFIMGEIKHPSMRKFSIVANYTRSFWSDHQKLLKPIVIHMAKEGKKEVEKVPAPFLEKFRDKMLKPRLEKLFRELYDKYYEEEKVMSPLTASTKALNRVMSLDSPIFSSSGRIIQEAILEAEKDSSRTLYKPDIADGLWSEAEDIYDQLLQKIQGDTYQTEVAIDSREVSQIIERQIHETEEGINSSIRHAIGEFFKSYKKGAVPIPEVAKICLEKAKEARALAIEYWFHQYPDLNEYRGNFEVQFDDERLLKEYIGGINSRRVDEITTAHFDVLIQHKINESFTRRFNEEFNKQLESYRRSAAYSFRSPIEAEAVVWEDLAKYTGWKGALLGPVLADLTEYVRENDLTHPGLVESRYGAEIEDKINSEVQRRIGEAKAKASQHLQEISEPQIAQVNQWLGGFADEFANRSIEAALRQKPLSKDAAENNILQIETLLNKAQGGLTDSVLINLEGQFKKAKASFESAHPDMVSSIKTALQSSETLNELKTHVVRRLQSKLEAASQELHDRIGEQIQRQYQETQEGISSSIRHAIGEFFRSYKGPAVHQVAESCLEKAKEARDLAIEYWFHKYLGLNKYRAGFESQFNDERLLKEYIGEINSSRVEEIVTAHIDVLVQHKINESFTKHFNETLNRNLNDFRYGAPRNLSPEEKEVFAWQSMKEYMGWNDEILGPVLADLAEYVKENQLIDSDLVYPFYGLLVEDKINSEVKGRIKEAKARAVQRVQEASDSQEAEAVQWFSGFADEFANRSIEDALRQKPLSKDAAENNVLQIETLLKKAQGGLTDSVLRNLEDQFKKAKASFESAHPDMVNSVKTVFQSGEMLEELKSFVVRRLQSKLEAASQELRGHIEEQIQRQIPLLDNNPDWDERFKKTIGAELEKYKKPTLEQQLKAMLAKDTLAFEKLGERLKIWIDGRIDVMDLLRETKDALKNRYTSEFSACQAESVTYWMAMQDVEASLLTLENERQVKMQELRKLQLAEPRVLVKEPNPRIGALKTELEAIKLAKKGFKEKQKQFRVSKLKADFFSDAALIIGANGGKIPEDFEGQLGMTESKYNGDDWAIIMKESSAWPDEAKKRFTPTAPEL